LKLEAAYWVRLRQAERRAGRNTRLPWCRLLDVEVEATFGDGQFVVLKPTKEGLRMAFREFLRPKQARTDSTLT
jgi:hypothetical protein